VTQAKFQIDLLDRSNDGGFIDASPWTDKDEATGVSNRQC